MPKLGQVIGGPETNIYFQATICRTFILVVPQTIIVGLTKGGNQEKVQKHSEKVAHKNLCCIVVGLLLRSVDICLNICSKLVRNTTFSECFSASSWFPPLGRPTMMVCGTARTHVRRIVAWQYIFVLVPPITSWSFGMEFFHVLYIIFYILLNIVW